MPYCREHNYSSYPDSNGNEETNCPYCEIKSLQETIETIEHEVSIVYTEITGGRISKPNTLSVHVLSAANDYEAEEITRLTAEIAALRELLHEIAVAGVPFDDPRIDYVEIRVDKDTMAEIRSAIDEARGEEK